MTTTDSQATLADRTWQLTRAFREGVEMPDDDPAALAMALKVIHDKYVPVEMLPAIRRAFADGRRARAAALRSVGE